MPAPPPKGASSTLRCGSLAAERRSCTRDSMSPCTPARPRTLGCSRRDELGEDREDIEAERERPALASRSQSNSPRAHRRRGGPSTPDHEAQRTRCAALEHEEVARRVGLHGDDPPCRAVWLDHLAADQLVDEELGVLDGRLGQQRHRATPRRLSGVNAFEVTRWRSWNGPGRKVEQLRALAPGGASTAARPGARRSGAVGDEHDDDLTGEPVGLDDPADLEERPLASSRRGASRSVDDVDRGLQPSRAAAARTSVRKACAVRPAGR